MLENLGAGKRSDIKLSGVPGGQTPSEGGGLLLQTPRNYYCYSEAIEANKHKTSKQFSERPCGTIVQGTNLHPSQGQTGRISEFTVQFDRRRPACRRDGSQLFQGREAFVPGTVPVCPWHRPAQNVYVYWSFSCRIYGSFPLLTYYLRFVRSL